MLNIDVRQRQVAVTGDMRLGANRTHAGLKVEAERILEEAAEIDAREDELHGDRRGDELPDQLADPATRQAKIRELLERARAREAQIDADRAAMHARQERHEQTTGRRPRPPRAKAAPGTV